MKEWSQGINPILSKLDMDDDKLPANNGGCATSGSKVMTQIVNKLKMRSNTGKVASVGF